MRMPVRLAKTQHHYVRRSGNLPADRGTPPLRNYQITSCIWSTRKLNAAICGLKFFFGVTLDRWAMAKDETGHLPRKLPDILGPDGSAVPPPVT